MMRKEEAMKIKRFLILKGIGLLTVVFVFSKIYQQNRVIKFQYEKQRLEVLHSMLLKKKNELLVSVSQEKDYDFLRHKAETQKGMSPLLLSKLITFTGVQR